MVKNVNSCVLASTSSTYNHTNPSILRTPTIPRKSPRKRNIWVDELVIFQVADQTEFTWKLHLYRFDNSGLHFNLKCNEETGVLAVHEYISADRNLHVRLSYHGLVILLPQWFRYKNYSTFTKFSMLEISYLRSNKGDRSKWAF